MGFESFGVELDGGTATPDELAQAISAIENVTIDEDSMLMPGASYFLYRDAQHAIEMELTRSPLRLSCRFTICHPPSVDSAFLEFIRCFLNEFGMRVRICDDVAPEDDHDFSLSQFAEFSQALVRYTAARRQEWKAAFGNLEIGATTNEVHERIILPLCQIPIEKAG